MHGWKKLSPEHCIFLTLQQPMQSPCIVSNTMLISAGQAEEWSVTVLPGYWVSKVHIVFAYFSSEWLMPEDEDRHSLSCTNYEHCDSQVRENGFRLSKPEHSGPDPEKFLNSCLHFIQVESVGPKLLCLVKALRAECLCLGGSGFV